MFAYFSSQCVLHLPASRLAKHCPPSGFHRAQGLPYSTSYPILLTGLYGPSPSGL